MTSSSTSHLKDLEAQPLDGLPSTPIDGQETIFSKSDLDPVLDVPITMTAILGNAALPIGEVLQLGPGSIIELDRTVGEPIEIYINDQIVGRGEVVLVDERLGITLTEVIKN